MSVFDDKRDAENCERCNYDTHRCPGCGEPLPHGTEVCGSCTLEFCAAVPDCQCVYCTSDED